MKNLIHYSYKLLKKFLNYNMEIINLNDNEVIPFFKKKTPSQKIKILEKSLELAIKNKAGTYTAAIAFGMDLKWDDRGYFTNDSDYMH